MSLRSQSLALEKRLEAIPAEILEALRPVLMQSGEEIATGMKALAESSRDTGALIDSITVTGPNETTPAYAEGGGRRTAGSRLLRWCRPAQRNHSWRSRRTWQCRCR